MGKYIKNTVYSILILSIILSTLFAFCTPVVLANETAENYDNEVNIHTVLMKELGIFNGIPDFDGERKVKRWEFIAMCMNLTNSYLPKNYEDVFSDVPAASSYASYVYGGYQKGWVALNSAKTFNPELDITLEQAIKITVMITGYDLKAMSLGGYPSGYMDVAYQHNILSGIKISGNEKISFDTASKIFYNLFKAPFAYPVGVGDGIEYKYGDHTLFSYYHNLYKNTGIVTAVKNGTTGINSRNLEAGKIEIDNEVYDTDKDYENLLGKKTEYFCYIYENDDRKEILFAYEHPSNKSLSIDKEYIIGLTDDFVLKYETEDGKLWEEKISSSVNVIFNNNYAVKIINYPKEEIINADEIRLLDNDGDGKWDFVFIEKSQIYYIDNVATESMYFNSLYDGSYVNLLDVPLSEMPVIIKNGVKTTFKSIKKQNVAEVKRNYHGTKIISIDVTSDDISGKVENVITSSDEAFITVDGKEYKVHEVFLKSEEYSVEIGQEVTFALSKKGEIAGYKKRSSNMGYGYIISMRVIPDGPDYNLIVRMMNFEGDVVNYQFSDKFYLDSVRYDDKSKETLENVIKELEKTGTHSNYIGGIYESEADLIPNTIALKAGIHQLVMYTLDKKLKISKLDTVKDDKNNKLTRDMMPKFHATASPSVRYLSAGNIMADLNSNQRFIMSADTLVYTVPVNGKDDIYNYQVGDRSTVKGLEYHTVHAYNVDPDTLVAEVVIVEKGDAKKSGAVQTTSNGGIRSFINISQDSTKYSIITKVVQSVDDEGDPATKVYTLYQKQEEYFYVSSETFVYTYKDCKENGETNTVALNSSSLKPGQVIANTVVPGNKYAQTVCIVGDVPADAQNGTYIIGASGYDECIFGKLTGRKNATVKADILKNGEWLTYAYNVSSSAMVYKVNKNGNVEFFDLNSITYELDRYVFIRSRVGRVPLVVIYDR